jgi:peptidoglycan hydrolase-like protein with peptidoglycan-binding domain
MRQYDSAEKDDRIQRTLDRMALLRKIDEAASARKKLQAKSALTISPVDDPQEKEADAVAKKVVSGEDAKTEMNSSLVNVQMKKEEEMLMAKTEDGMLAGTEQLQTTLDSSKGSGTPLDANTQNEIGGKMGADLSDVKIHTDSKANEMSEGINAKAFTHGQDIYFKQGNFDTNSNQGKELLAHELTHTVQQKGGVSRKIQRKKTGNDPLISEFFRQNSRFSEINNDDSVLMQKGDKGDAVKLLQQALLELNYSLPEFGDDGSFGDETAQALKNFQIDSGMTGAEADGILGHKTLRLLDERFAAVSKKNLVGSGGAAGGNNFVFNITVPYNMTYAEFLPHALVEIFGISPLEASTMVKSGWYIDNYHEISEKEISVGYKRISITKERYEKIKGKGIYSTESSSDGKEDKKTAREDVEESYNKLSGKEKLYELNEKIRVKREYMDTLRPVDKFDMQRVSDALKKANEELSVLLKERDAELLRLGLTNDVFEKDQDNFIKAFDAFAYETAFKMLRENETSARIELDRYQQLTAVKEISTILKQLYKYNNDSDRLWWKGLSYAETGDPDKIYGEMSLMAEHPDVDPDPKINTSSETAQRIIEKYQQYKYEVKGGNTYFEQSYDTKHAQYALLQEKSIEYPILAHKDLQVDQVGNMNKKTDQELQILLLKTIQGEDKKGGILGDIKTTRENISSDPAKIWELNPVIQRAKAEMGIIPGSIHDTLINKKVKKASEMSWWEIAMAAFGILLGVLALLSGPIGWIALAGSLTIGGIEAKIAYDKASVRDAAHGSAMDPNKALSEVPGNWLWFYLSLVCIGMDALVVFRLVKLGVKSVSQGSKALNLFDKIANGTIKNGDEFVKATKEGLTLSQKETKELIEAQNKIIAGTKDVKKIKTANEEINRLTTELSGLEKSLAETSGPAFLSKSRILVGVVDNPVIFKNIAEAMANAKYSEAFIKLEAMLASHPELLRDIVRFYGGAGKTWLSQFPEVMSVLEKSTIRPGTDLFMELMTQPKVQKVFLDNKETPDLLLDAWEKWILAKTRTKPPPVQIPFVDYLSQGLGFKTSLKTTESLVSKFGNEFTTWAPLKKNRHILRASDKTLADALDQNLLPPNVEKAILELFDKDVIKGAQTFEGARGALMKQLNETIGNSIDNVDDFKKVMGFIEQPASRGSIGEHYAINKKLLGGVGDEITHPKPIDVSGLGLKNPQKFHPDELIVNKNKGILGDIKTGYPTGAVDLDQVDNYVSIFAGRNDPKFKDLFKAIGIDPQDFKGVEYLMLPGKTGDSYTSAMKAYWNIFNRSKTAEKMLTDGNFVIKYLDETDNIVKIFKP